MKFFLLDGGGAGLLYIGLFLLLVFTALAILLEALIMVMFKYNLFKKALGHSSVANLASLAAGFVLISSAEDVFNLDDLSGYAAFFGVTVAIELLILYLCNKQKPFQRTLLVCVVMNLVTYFFLYLFAGANSL